MLKLIAALLMVIDHIGLIFFSPTSTIYLLCRLIGRLSMPIFAYKIASGYMYTKNFNKYIWRLLGMTLAAQIPFTWLIYRGQFFEALRLTNGLCLFQYWNIGLTFLCALLILRLLANLSISSGFLILLLGIIGNMGDYGLYGIGMVVVFYYFQCRKITFTQCFSLLLALCFYQSFTWGMSLFTTALSNTLPALLSLFLIRYIPDTSLKLPRNFFYLFYPLHMLILLLINEILHYL